MFDKRIFIFLVSDKKNNVRAYFRHEQAVYIVLSQKFGIPLGKPIQQNKDTSSTF